MKDINQQAERLSIFIFGSLLKFQSEQGNIHFDVSKRICNFIKTRSNVSYQSSKKILDHHSGLSGYLSVAFVPNCIMTVGNFIRLETQSLHAKENRKSSMRFTLC